jgi:ribosomal-protein-alanine N-acetyltransferase
MEAIDLDDVMAIEQMAFSAPWTKEMFYSEFFDNRLSFSFVAKECDQVGEAPWALPMEGATRGTTRASVIGYLFAWEVAGEFHLMNIAVAPQWLRRGIGEALIKTMCSAGKERGIGQILLEVRASNFSAISLYEKLKFCKIGLRKNYYHSPTEDALILQYDLGSS